MTGRRAETHPPLLGPWSEAVLRTKLARDLLARLREGSQATLPALPGSLGTVLLASAADRLERPLLAVFPESDEAAAAALDFATLLGEERVAFLPPIPAAAYEEFTPDPTLIVERHDALRRLLVPGAAAGVVVAPIRALLLPVPSPADLRQLYLELAVGRRCALTWLVGWLAAAGYEREPMAQRPGEFAVRGGLVDIVPPGRTRGLRIEYWGDEIESIREYSLRDQRSIGGQGQAEVPAAAPFIIDDETRVRAAGRTAEFAPDLIEKTPLGAVGAERGRPDGLFWYYPFFLERAGRVTELLPESTLVALWEPERIEPVVKGTAAEFEARYEAREDAGGWPSPAELEPGAGFLDRLGGAYAGARLPLVAPPAEAILTTNARPAGTFSGDFPALREELAALGRTGIRTVILVEDSGQKKRLTDLLIPESTGQNPPEIVIGQLERGFTWPEAALAVWPDHELFGRPRRPAVRRSFPGEAIGTWQVLSVGDHVVHVDHGIGRFEGLRTMEVDEREHELLELTYAGNDRLLVPVDQLYRVRRYAGTDPDSPPALNTLGTAGWERTVERARTDLLEMASELARIYAVRETAERPGWPADDLMMEELEAGFPWTETPDQARAVEAVKRDLEADRPMDRLICGDVGYGKTEVAIRAALKVIEGGGQVAVLVPTTVLAQQHLETFRSRLERVPVRIEMLSRFRTPVQQRGTLEGLAAGTTDLVIGTHRLLSPDVDFARLGLIVIDEEHRFGVRAKEKLRALRARVDVLSMTATPIPRTLHMSLSGLRDISIITTPPEDRLPVHTEVVTFDEELIETAIRRERERGGQVFFVHNRVRSIEAVAQLLARLVPEARIEIGHGQMSERRLERVMLEFTAGAVDVLVSTMIIESGLDLPNANTLIVNRADRLGLAQLYQLRGRVGRSNLRARAYFMVPRGRTLGPDARSRLRALREYTDLGAGLELALRDLEIRGTGNLLGPQQHGHIAAVGLDLYQQMLDEAIAEIRGSPGTTRIPPRVEIDAEALLPESYIPVPSARIALYRRAVEARTLDELGEVANELTDRFGPPPPAARAFLEVAVLRWIGTELGLDSLVVERNRLLARFRTGVTLDPDQWEELLERLGEAARFRGRDPLTCELALTSTGAAERLAEARNFLLTEDEAEYVTEFMSGSKSAEGAQHGQR